MENNIKDEFISTLSHEIRTPLTSIKGFSKTILDNYENLSDEQKIKFINIIQEQSNRLIHLVENVLNVSKIDSGKNDAIFTKVDLNLLAQKVMTVLKVNYKNFEFNFNSKSSEPVLSDANKVEQILINILDNALKYSNNSKKIDVELKQDKEFAILSVKNYGIEIEEKYFEKIFEKFYRIDSHLTSTTQGSGLGLYITKNLIEQLNGKIFIKSSQDEKFVEFTIQLPLYKIEDITKNINKSKE